MPFSAPGFFCFRRFHLRHNGGTGRDYNDANVLCFGGRVVGPGLALQLVDAFLDNEFEGGRHQRRIDKVMALENE